MMEKNMLTVTEKVAYLKGLMEGLEFDAETKEGKIIKMMADILEDVASSITELEDDVADINEYMEAMDEDLTNIEDQIFGECEEDDCDCCCDECDEDCDCVEVTCPACGKNIIMEEAPEGDGMVCPACGAEIQFE